MQLLPAKPALDSVLLDKDPSLLKTLLHDLDLTDEYVILIDTGPDGECVVMGTTAADVVFIPMLLSRQDVHPTVETLRTVFNKQKENGSAVLGGFVVNQTGETKWEQDYIDRYIQLLDQFQNKSKLMGATESLFIKLSQSRIIRKGVFLDCSFREDYLKDYPGGDGDSIRHCECYGCCSGGTLFPRISIAKALSFKRLGTVGQYCAFFVAAFPHTLAVSFHNPGGASPSISCIQEAEHLSGHPGP